MRPGACSSVDGEWHSSLELARIDDDDGGVDQGVATYSSSYPI